VINSLGAAHGSFGPSHGAADRTHGFPAGGAGALRDELVAAGVLVPGVGELRAVTLPPGAAVVRLDAAGRAAAAREIARARRRVVRL
jgi:hypothetical protein